MRRERSSASWFATLRRDRCLFAFVGALTLLLGMLQPLAAAENAGFQGLSVLCSTADSPAGHVPDQGPDCPLCPAGHLCAMHGAIAAPVSLSGWAVSSPSPDRPRPVRTSASLNAADGAVPPSIRAPPLFA